MNRFLKIALAAAVVAGTAAVVAGVDDSAWQPGPSKAWFVNWDKALAEAQTSGKALFLLNTGSDWCGWCKRLKADVLDTQEFAEFASQKLVLVYLDSPHRNPLGKEQRAHNRLITKSLPFGGGVPHVLVMNAKGEKLGAIGGGGMKVEPYLEKLRGILSERGEAVKGENARRLFSDGYEKTAAAIAAARAALPPVTTNDFKAVLTGVAVVDGKRRYKYDDAVFVPPETELEVPFGKTVLFRVEYDFPKEKEYGARVWVRDEAFADGKRHAWYFGSNPSGLYNGKGVAYGFLSLLDRGKACKLTSVAIRTNTDPELDDHPHGWKIASVPVNLEFKEKDGDAGDAGEEADAPAVSKSVPKGWTEDFEAAKQQAAKEGKLILMDFSGSDWCGWCKKMDEEVFTKDRFVREASKKFVLVSVDSPRDKSILSALARKQNKALAETYEVRGYPTVVIVDPDGKEVKRHSGYRAGGPNGYLKYLRELTRRVKWPKKSQ
ncbi:MAG: thioredoxin family protein [Kiritimatiellae bacterium]|nr:thioredoxin family protein [Kiritimatiellia bacterium]